MAARFRAPLVDVLRGCWFPWAVVGLAAVSRVVLRKIGVLLTDVNAGQTQTYSPSVFSGPRRLSSTEITDAFDVWDNDRDGARRWVNAYLLIDTLLFAPALYYLLYRLLRRVNRTHAPAVLACGVLATDWAENAVVAISRGKSVPWLAALLSDLKWCMLLLAAVFGLISWRSRRDQRDQSQVHPDIRLR